MKTRLFAAISLVFAIGVYASSSVPVAVRQNWPWDGRIFIDVTMPAGTNDVELTATFDNDGAHREIVLGFGNGLAQSTFCLTGGVHRFVWDPKSAGCNGAISSLDISAQAAAPGERAWLVIDLATGAHEYVALGDEPADAAGKPWQDVQYKSTKMVFRRIPAGKFVRGYTAEEKAYLKKLDTDPAPDGLGLDATTVDGLTLLTATEVELTSDFYMAIYQTTRSQIYTLLEGGRSFNGPYTPESGQVAPDGCHCFQRGSNSVEGIRWPATKFAVTENSVIGRFRARCGNRFWIDLPTSAQWHRAARPDTSVLWYDVPGYGGGKIGDSLDTVTNILASISDGYRRAFAGGGGLWSAPTEAGTYLPNSYGLYDLVGSRTELLLDRCDWNVEIEKTPAGDTVDPVGWTEKNYANTLVANSFVNKKSITQMSEASTGRVNGDAKDDTTNAQTFRYVIHLNPPKSFDGKWIDE